MFEREFEFTVQHPLDVCAKRIVDMNKQSGCLLLLSPRIVSEIVARDHNYFEFDIHRSGFTYDQTNIEAEVEVVNRGTCRVIGVAAPVDSLFMTYLIIGIVLLLAMSSIGGVLIGIVIFMFMLCLMMMDAIWSIFWREWLIRNLETTLMYPKKKKRA